MGGGERKVGGKEGFEYGGVDYYCLGECLLFVPAGEGRGWGVFFGGNVCKQTNMIPPWLDFFFPSYCGLLLARECKSARNLFSNNFLFKISPIFLPAVGPKQQKFLPNSSGHN